MKTRFCDDGEIKATARGRDAAGGEINERGGAVDAETQNSQRVPRESITHDTHSVETLSCALPWRCQSHAHIR